MEKKLKIIHCSDLHLDTDKLVDCSIVIDAFKKDIAKKEEKNGFDLFLFTGDLVKKGDNENAFLVTKEKFIDESLTAAKIDKSKLCIVPGNHDVQLSKLNKYSEDGISGNLVSRDAINQFIDDLKPSNESLIAPRFEYFNKHILEAKNSTTFSLHRSQIFDFPFGKIGVAMINSAWRASGKQNDYDHGKLIVGERQIDMAANELSGSDFKIAMLHHAPDCLLPADKTSVVRALQRNFDLVLVGHSHYQDSMSLVGLTGRYIQSQTGCLYAKRDYFNGYSIIEIDFERNKLQVEMREYFDQRREFDKAVGFAEGIMSYPLQSDNGAIDLVLSEEAETAFHDVINQRLLSAVASESAPKSIRELFVAPVLSSQTGSEINSTSGEKPEKEYAIDSLMRDTKSIVIYGHKESGKTTLLNFIAIESLPGGLYFSGLLPLRLNFHEIGKTTATIFEGIRKTSGTAIEIKQIRKALKSAKAILLIDDVDIYQSDKIDVLREFLSEYKQNKIILTVRRDPIGSSANIEKHLNIETQNLHIKYFTWKQVKELSSRWIKSDGVNISDVTSKIILAAQRIHAPLTPLLVSILLWFHDRNISFEPVNQAVLLQTFVRELMGRLAVNSGRRADLDTRNYEHFLGHLAEFFAKECRDTASRIEVEKVAVEYFSRFDMHLLKLSVGDVIGDLITRGVLVETDAGIGFRYSCFFEYFAALRMSDDKNFYQEITNEENVLRFAREIDTYTALCRNDLPLLRTLINMTTDLFSSYEEKYEFSGFERLPFLASSDNQLSNEEIRKDLEATKLDDDLREKVFDVDSSAHENQCPVSIQREREHYYPGELLDLVSRVLRNSELVELQETERGELTAKVCSYWTLLIADIMVQIEKGEEIPKEIEAIGPVFPLIVLPQILLSISAEALGSAKIGHILRSLSNDKNNPLIVRLFAALIYFELRLDKRIELLNHITPSIANKRFLLGMVLTKLRLAYTFSEYRKEEEQQLITLLTDLIISINNPGGSKKQQLSIVRTEIQKKLKTSRFMIGAELITN